MERNDSIVYCNVVGEWKISRVYTGNLNYLIYTRMKSRFIPKNNNIVLISNQIGRDDSNHFSYLPV
jgi:hypothetical protein